MMLNSVIITEVSMMIKREDLKTTDFTEVSTGIKLELVRPGEVLADFLDDYEITPYRLAKDIGVPQTRIAAIIKDGRAITADTALRLGQYFCNSAQFWMNLQSYYELKTEEEHIHNELDNIISRKLAV